MTEHNLEEFEYSRGDLRIRLRKPSAGVVVSASRTLTAPEIIVPGSVEPQSAASGGSPAPEARSTEELHLVKPPIVGRYYESPRPGRQHFGKVVPDAETRHVRCAVQAMTAGDAIDA